MNIFDEYIHQVEPQKREKGYAWQTAIGLQAVDGLTPSDYLLDAARKEIEGELTIDEVEQLIKSYYQSKEVRTPEDDERQEADRASTKIRQLLTEQTFAFSLVGLTSIHCRIFTGIYKFAGQIRDYNITKKEWVLRGDTVLYVPATDICKSIEYDLEQERQFDYSNVDNNSLISHISKFVSGLWQIHPFGEGNTRTTAVFTIKYLRSLGFDVTNDMFAKHSWYFRNALVRANYQNIKLGVLRNSEFLEKFFRNLLLGENHELRNRYMLIAPREDLPPASTPISTPVSGKNAGILPDNDNIIRLIKVLANNRMSLKEMIEAVGLKDRNNFVEYSLNPAIKGGFVTKLYPDKPRHPRQKYLLTVKGTVIYNELK